MEAQKHKHLSGNNMDKYQLPAEPFVLYSVDRNHAVKGTKISMLNPWRCLTTSHSQSRQRAKGKR